MTCQPCKHLDPCPDDARQRMEDGLGSVLAVLGNECGEFDFKNMVDNASDPASDPTADLPVLFSSQGFRSHMPVETSFPKMTQEGLPIDEYWFGMGARNENTLCMRSFLSTYYFLLKERQWFKWSENKGGIWNFRSVNDKTLSQTLTLGTNPPISQVRATRLLDESKTPPLVETVVVGPPLSHLTELQMSANGEVYFAKQGDGWKRWSATKWEPVGLPSGALDLWLVPSFDGLSFVQTTQSPPMLYCQLGWSAILQERAIPNDSTGHIYAAVLRNTVFIARGKFLYTVGSLNELNMIGELKTGVATGVWADDQVVWVGKSVV